MTEQETTHKSFYPKKYCRFLLKDVVAQIGHLRGGRVEKRPYFRALSYWYIVQDGVQKKAGRS